jgi:pentatricopeptide repeat protein
MLIEFHSNVAQNLDNALLVLENACKLGMAQNMLQACAVLVRRCHPDSAGPAYTKHIKQIIQIMEFYDITPNQDILATAIDALVKEGLVQDAITIFNDLEEVYKIKPNVNMYGSIIQAFSNANDLENAVTIYWKMLAKNITPNSRTILKLITAVSRKAADAHSSGNLNPNVKGITLSEIIDQLCEGLVIAEDIDEEFELKSQQYYRRFLEAVV